MTAVEPPSLHTWMPTNDFSQLVEKLMQPIDSGTLFNSSDKKHQDLMEAHCTAKFARTLGYFKCKLIEGEFPDAACRNNEEKIVIEITELQDKDRRRGDEYRNDPIVTLQSEDLLSSVETNWQKWLIAAIDKKITALHKKIAEETYDIEQGKIDLVVYMNVSLYVYSSERDQFWSQMQEIPTIFAQKPDGIPFKRVWIVYKNYALKVWPEFQKFTDPSAIMEN